MWSCFGVVLDNDLVLGFAENEANRRLVCWMLNPATSLVLFSSFAVSYLRHGYCSTSQGRYAIRKTRELSMKSSLGKIRHCRGPNDASRGGRRRALQTFNISAHGHFFRFDHYAGRAHVYEEERTSIRDVRRQPIKFEGHSIGYQNEHR